MYPGVKVRILGDVAGHFILLTLTSKGGPLPNDASRGLAGTVAERLAYTSG